MSVQSVNRFCVVQAYSQQTMLCVVWAKAPYSQQSMLCGVQGKAPLMRAASEGHVQVVQWLLSQGVEVDAKDTRVTPISLNIVLIINIVSKRQRLASYICRDFDKS